MVIWLSESVPLPKQWLSSLQRASESSSLQPTLTALCRSGQSSPSIETVEMFNWRSGLLGKPHADHTLFSACSQHNLGEPAASCPPVPRARPSPSSLAIYHLLHPAFTRAPLSSRLLPPSQIIRKFELFSVFLNVELLRPGRHLTICCRLLFWGFSLGVTLV